MERSGYAILVGEPLQDFATGRNHYARYHREYFGDSFTDTPIEEWTVGAFRVTEVLHQPDGGDISPGQIIWLSEPVGLQNDGSKGFFVSAMAGCTELKHNSRYVVFANKDTDGTYLSQNLNLGRFNIDGTDPDDEDGGGVDASGAKTGKQRLREELADRYGVRFNFLPQPSITRIAPLPKSQMSWGKSDTLIRVSIPSAISESASLTMEQMRGDGGWEPANEIPVLIREVKANCTTVSVYVDRPSSDVQYRVRLVANGRTSNYSEAVSYPYPEVLPKIP